MKKIILLLLVVLFVAGCSNVNIYKISNENISSITKSILNNKSYISNGSFPGFKYYLPKGVSLVDKRDYNMILLDNNTTYYLYLDVVKYYHKTKNTFTENNDSYYSKNISYNGKEGYIEINKSNNKYFVEVMYNYAKIETYLEEANIKYALTNILVILSSVDYNDKVLATLVGDNILKSSEENIDIFTPKRKESNFLEYVEDFGKYSSSKDFDKIEIEEFE